MQIDMSVLIALVGVILAVVTFIIGRQSAGHAAGEQTGMIMGKLDSISASLAEIKADVSSTRKDVTELRERVVSCEMSVKSAHKRLDDAGIGRSIDVQGL
jgi:outer membrane murein-binding lipoprotein Lpp